MKKPAFKLSLLAIVLVGLAFSCASSKSTNMTSRQKVLKGIYPMLTRVSRFFGSNNKLILADKKVTPPVSIYDQQFELIDGSPCSLSEFRGKKILIVNTASDCGYTGQYEELQQLYAQKKKELVIIGFPSNDFKQQEKGSNEQIAAFCKKNYGVEFPIAAKSVVLNKADQHPLYQWLSDPARNGWNKKVPSWNFSKYLIDEQGVLIGYADPAVSPLAKEFSDLLNTVRP